MPRLRESGAGHFGMKGDLCAPVQQVSKRETRSERGYRKQKAKHVQYIDAIWDSIGHLRVRGTGFGAAVRQYASARIRELNYPNSM